MPSHLEDVAWYEGDDDANWDRILELRLVIYVTHIASGRTVKLYQGWADMTGGAFHTGFNKMPSHVSDGVDVRIYCKPLFHDLTGKISLVFCEDDEDEYWDDLDADGVSLYLTNLLFVD